MKSIRTLRSLSLLGFLLLMAPFYDHCGGHRFKKAEAATEEVMVDATAVGMPVMEKDTLIVENNIAKDSVIDSKICEPSFFQNIYEFVDDSNSENAFEIAMMNKVYFDVTFKEFKTELIKEIKKDYRVITFHIKNISFLFIIFFSTSILLLSFFKKTKLIHQFSIINLVLLLITIICILFFDPSFETYKQIKWGYYVFTLVQLGIFYTSNLKSKI